MDECLKSEQAANPDAGKEGSVLNLGIIMIPGCVFVLANKHKCAHRLTNTHNDRHTHQHTRMHIRTLPIALCFQFKQSEASGPV